MRRAKCTQVIMLKELDKEEGVLTENQLRLSKEGDNVLPPSCLAEPAGIHLAHISHTNDTNSKGALIHDDSGRSHCVEYNYVSKKISAMERRIEEFIKNSHPPLLNLNLVVGGKKLLFGEEMQVEKGKAFCLSTFSR